MIRFMYNRDYNDRRTRVNVGGELSALDTNTLVYALGDKYNMPALQHLAWNKFAKIVVEEWNPDQFVEVLRAAYSTTPDRDRGLRRLIQVITQFHLHELSSRTDFSTVMEEVPEFVVDMIIQATAPASILFHGGHHVFLLTCADCGLGSS